MLKETLDWSVGILIVANIGTIGTVIVSALRLSAQFGGLKNQVEVNKENINKNEARILQCEQRSM